MGLVGRFGTDLDQRAGRGVACGTKRSPKGCAALKTVVLAVLSVAALAMTACGTASSAPANTSKNGGATVTRSTTSRALSHPKSGPVKVSATVRNVGCSPVSADSVGVGRHPAKSLRLTARLGAYTATISGIRLVALAGVRLYQFKSAYVTVSDPAGRFSVSLGGPPNRGIDGLTPSGVGPGRGDSPFCLVQFGDASRPTVILGAGGPRMTLDSTFAYVVGVPITATGVRAPITDLPVTGGQAGLGGERLVLSNGRPLLVGSNGGFGYEGAFTAQPPIVAGFADGHFTNLTRSYPGLIATSAPGFLRMWEQGAGHKPPANNFAPPAIVAWAAVECATGHQTAAYAKLSALRSAGWFTASFEHSSENEMVRLGYCVA